MLNAEVKPVLPATIEGDIILPVADIDGLRFDETTVHAVFERQGDDSYQSRDILFLSARNVIDDTGRDILSEYLASERVKEVFRPLLVHIPGAEDTEVEVYLPQENKGVKKYHGVDWWYWLADKASAARFASVYNYGDANGNNASAVGGCAPAFCVAPGRYR
jgi:hypothetical protein